MVVQVQGLILAPVSSMWDHCLIIIIIIIIIVIIITVHITFTMTIIIVIVMNSIKSHFQCQWHTSTNSSFRNPCKFIQFMLLFCLLAKYFTSQKVAFASSHSTKSCHYPEYRRKYSYSNFSVGVQGNVGWEHCGWRRTRRPWYLVRKFPW